MRLNKVFRCLFEFGQCMSSSHILNFGPWLLFHIRDSWYFWQRLLIWRLKRGVHLLIWLRILAVYQKMVFNNWFQFFCPYTCIYIICYIQFWTYGAILSQGIIRILVLWGILWIAIYCNACKSFGVFIFKGNQIV